MVVIFLFAMVCCCDLFTILCFVAWADEKDNVSNHQVLRLIYQGRFLHENVTFSGLQIQNICVCFYKEIKFFKCMLCLYLFLAILIFFEFMKRKPNLDSVRQILNDWFLLVK